jgi:hypothetical protein
VSEWTGGSDFVAEVDPRFVVPLDASALAGRIRWYFDLPPDERRLFGDRARTVVRTRCSEAQAAAAFREAVRRLLDRFGQGHLSLPDRRDAVLGEPIGSTRAP